MWVGKHQNSSFACKWFMCVNDCSGVDTVVFWTSDRAACLGLRFSDMNSRECLHKWVQTFSEACHTEFMFLFATHRHGHRSFTPKWSFQADIFICVYRSTLSFQFQKHHQHNNLLTVKTISVCILPSAHSDIFWTFYWGVGRKTSGECQQLSSDILQNITKN